MAPVGGDGNEGDELAGDFVDDYVAGVFAAGFAGYDGGGWDADEGDGEAAMLCRWLGREAMGGEMVRPNQRRSAAIAP